MRTDILTLKGLSSANFDRDGNILVVCSEGGRPQLWKIEYNGQSFGRRQVLTTATGLTVFNFLPLPSGEIVFEGSFGGKPNVFLLTPEQVRYVNCNPEKEDSLGCFLRDNVFFLSNQSLFCFDIRQPLSSFIKFNDLSGDILSIQDISIDGFIVVFFLEKFGQGIYILEGKRYGQKKVLFFPKEKKFSYLRFSFDQKSLLAVVDRNVEQFNFEENIWIKLDVDNDNRASVVNIARGSSGFLIAREKKGCGSIELWSTITQRRVLDFGLRFGSPRCVRWSIDGRRFLFITPTVKGKSSLFVAEIGDK